MAVITRWSYKRGGRKAGHCIEFRVFNFRTMFGLRVLNFANFFKIAKFSKNKLYVNHQNRSLHNSFDAKSKLKIDVSDYPI